MPSPSSSTESFAAMSLSRASTMVEKSKALSRTSTMLSRTLSEPLHPLTSTAAGVLTCFVLFLLVGIVAVYHPTEKVRDGMLAVNSALAFVAISLLFYQSLRIRRMWCKGTSANKLYNRAQGYTIISCLCMMVFCLIFYVVRWYPSLNRQVIVEQAEDLVHARLPNFAVLQNTNRHDQANMTDNPQYHPKAFLSDFTGGFDDVEIDCSTQDFNTILAKHRCNASSMWEPNIGTDLKGQYEDTIVYRIFRPADYLQVNSTTSTLTLQVFSNYNTSKFPDGWPIPEPALMVAVYDPSIPLEDAMSNGLGSVIEVNAMGLTTMSLDMQYRVGWGRPSYYFYRVIAASKSDLNMVCDVGKGSKGFCYITLQIRMTSLTRTTSMRTQDMTAGSVFAEAGGYLSLLQLIAFVISGMALGVNTSV